MLSGLKARLRRIEQALPPREQVLLEDGSIVSLPAGASMGLLVAVLAEARDGITPPIVEEHADTIARADPRQKDGSLLPLVKVLRAGFRQHDEHQVIEEVT